MLSDYTPSTEEVRANKIVRSGESYEVNLIQFDRWLAAHDVAVRADQIEKDAGIVEANAGARTSRQAFLIRAQLEGTTDE